MNDVAIPARGFFELTEWLARGRGAAEASRFEEARQAYLQAMKLAPNSIDALRGLGYSLLQLKRLDESLQMIERALAVDPSDLLSHLIMGRLCLRLQQPAGAEEHFRTILRRIENSAAARSGLIDALVAQGQLADAETLRDQILRADPQSEVGLLAAARVAALQRDDEAALRHFEALVRLRPGNAAHRYNRGLCLLRMGRFDEGWSDYEYRFAAGAVDLQLPSTPRWDGKRVGHLLVAAEQGLGDAILFSRFIGDAARAAEQVTLVCPDSLVGLLERSLGCTCIPDRGGELPPHDAHVPLMSLPHVLGLGAAAVAVRPAYLTVDAARRERWSEALGPRQNGEVRIGIVHATSVAHSTEENPFTCRSCPAEAFVSFTGAPGVAAYNLNVGRTAEQACEQLPGLRGLPRELGDFDDTAAVAGLMDAVVCVDTAIAHVTGATGVRTGLLLPYARDWRWMSREGRLPWYWSVQAAWQEEPGQWAAPVRELRDSLVADRVS
ncbi:MAG: tetratricopeptide repeat protein [Burkholderiaceae bacterium]|nr:tetratricopeptide repeat protein [Burkholderiaceae bacterium]